MRSRHRWLALPVPAALAALAALVFAVPAASSPPAAITRHVNRVAAAAPHMNAVVHIHPGLTKDCERIFSTDADGYISGHGVGNPVTIEGTGNCFTLMHEFSVRVDDWVTGTTVTATGWQYQNGDGHCLRERNSDWLLELYGACNARDTSEDFFGLPGSLKAFGAWVVSDVWDESSMMGFRNSCGGVGYNVIMSPNADCWLWTFPQG